MLLKRDLPKSTTTQDKLSWPPLAVARQHSDLSTPIFWSCSDDDDAGDDDVDTNDVDDEEDDGDDDDVDDEKGDDGDVYDDGIDDDDGDGDETAG